MKAQQGSSKTRSHPDPGAGRFRPSAARKEGRVASVSPHSPGLRRARRREPPSSLPGKRGPGDHPGQERPPAARSPEKGRGRKGAGPGRGAKTRTWRRSGFGAGRSRRSSCAAYCSAGEWSWALRDATGELGPGRPASGARREGLAVIGTLKTKTPEPSPSGGVFGCCAALGFPDVRGE